MNRLTLVRDGDQTIMVVLQTENNGPAEMEGATNKLRDYFPGVPVFGVSRLYGPPLEVEVISTPYAFDPNAGGQS